MEKYPGIYLEFTEKRKGIAYNWISIMSPKDKEGNRIANIKTLDIHLVHGDYIFADAVFLDGSKKRFVVMNIKSLAVSKGIPSGRNYKTMPA